MSNGNEKDFDVVAAGTVAEPGLEPTSPVADPIDGGPPAADEGELFQVPEWLALRAVQAVFVIPTLVKKDPRWIPSDVEAEGARPQMQKVMQRLLDEELPPQLSRWAQRNNAALDLAVALFMVGKVRYEEIKKAGPLPDPTKKPGEVVQMPSKAPSAAAPSVADGASAGEGRFECEVCMEKFASRAALAGHTCKGVAGA